MPRCLLSSSALALLCLTGAACAQSPAPGSASPYSSDGLNNAPIAAPAHAAAGSTSSVTASSGASPSAPAAPALDAGSLVKSVLAMFMPNAAVTVGSTGKPLPLTGSWGVQSQFPAGVPAPCAEAHVPCVKVIYRVPESGIVCEWTLAQVTVVKPQPDGTIKHVTRQLILDENDAAARYTLRKAWPAGESAPHPVSGERPGYPQIAQQAHVDGVVSVRLLVGPDGNVSNATPNSGPPMLQKAVLEAVRKWKFEPLALGHQPTSFEVDEQFSYAISRPHIASDMDGGGKLVLPETDPHFDPGFKTEGASSGSWLSCNAVGCSSAAPITPK